MNLRDHNVGKGSVELFKLMKEMRRGRASGGTEEKIKNGALNGPVILKRAVGALVSLCPISLSHFSVCCKDEVTTTEGPP